MVYYPFLGKVTMKILFLIPYPFKEAPSQRFRFEQYLDLLQENGFQVSSQSFWNEQTWRLLYKPGYTFQKIAGFIKGMVRRFAILIRLSTIGKHSRWMNTKSIVDNRIRIANLLITPFIKPTIFWNV